MKFEVKQVLENLTRSYQKALKNEPQVSLSKYSTAEDSLFDSSTFFELNSETVGSFMRKSNPVYLHPEDLVEFKLGEEVVEMTVQDLRQFKKKDFLDEAFNSYVKNQEVKVKVIRISSENAKKMAKKLLSIAQEYCAKGNQEILSVLKDSVQEDKIYLIKCTGHESGGVMDGTNCVALGNDWDFHPGCSGLTEYKSVSLGNWYGAGNLAQILSRSLKKEIVKVNVDNAGYDLLVYGSYDPEEKMGYQNSRGKSLQDLFYESRYQLK